MTQAPLKKRTVLYVVTKSNFGGAQRYVHDLATSLPRDRFEPIVAFGGTGAAHSQPGALAHMLAEAGVRTVLVPELGRDISVLRDWQSFLALWRLLRRERPDVVHLNSSKAGGLGALAARLCGVPRIIFTAHGWYFWERRSAPVRAITYFLSYLTVLLSHVTICISDFDSRALSSLPFSRTRIRVIRNGMAHIDFLSRAASRNALFSTEEQQTHRDDLWVLSTGELTTNKNYFVALDTIARHNTSAPQKIYYTIIGEGEQRHEIEQYIADTVSGNVVKLLGFVPDARRYYRGFDALFLPSRKEGVPYVLLEAGLADLPVLASDVGGIPEVIRSGESGILCAPDDTDAFAQALTRLADDAVLRTRLGSALHGNILHEYDTERMLAQTTALY